MTKDDVKLRDDIRKALGIPMPPKPESFEYCTVNPKPKLRVVK